MPIPVQPKIYHIVHIDNLASIIKKGGLCSDSIMSQRRGTTVIGMQGIKERRRTLPVSCHPGTCVGDYVPFYFCPRSVMLYVIHCANHSDLAYRGGQESIIHLEADLNEVVRRAEANNKLWAFTLSNAGSHYFEVRSDMEYLDEIDWDAVHAHQWSGNGVSRSVKEDKQAEFLVEEDFPWHLVERIGVHSERFAQRVYATMNGVEHRPRVEIRREWYY